MNTHDKLKYQTLDLLLDIAYRLTNFLKSSSLCFMTILGASIYYIYLGFRNSA